MIDYDLRNPFKLPSEDSKLHNPTPAFCELYKDCQTKKNAGKSFASIMSCGDVDTALEFSFNKATR